MKSLRFSICGNDHPHRHAIRLAGKHVTDVNRDQFLPRGNFAIDAMPVLQDLDFQRGRIANRAHVEQPASPPHQGRIAIIRVTVLLLELGQSLF